MLPILIALFATAALCFAAVHSLRDERNKRQRRLLWLTHSFALVLVWAQYYQQFREDKASNEQRVKQEKQHAELRTDAVEAAERHEKFLAEANQKYGTLLTRNEELEAKLEPVLEAARAKHPNLAETEAVKRLLAEVEKLNPKLEFLPDRTLVEQNVEGGPFRTTFYFQSRHPVAIRGARIELTFDHRAKRVEVLAPGTLPFQRNLNAVLKGKALTVTANILGEAGQLEIALLGEQPLKILDVKVQP